MEPQTTLIRTESRVELDSVSAVDVQFAFVGFPDDAELDDALGDGDYFEGGFVFGVFFEKGAVFEGGDELWNWERELVGDVVRGDKRGGEVIGGADRGR